MLAIRGREAGDAVQPRAARGGCVLDGALDAVAEFALAPRQAGDATLAAHHVARGQVVQHHLHTGRTRRPRDRLSRPGVRELVLDVAKARGARRGEALEELDLCEPRREIGGELRHNRRA